MGIRFLVVVAFVGAVVADAATPATADPASCLTATDVAAGDTFNLSAPIDASATVRLAGIIAPLPPASAPPDAPWPPATAARDGLAVLLGDRCLRLVPDAPMIDRYGRLYAHVYTTTDGTWIQGELVRRGLARVMPGLDAAETIRRLLPLEADARAAGRGLWANDLYAVRPADRVDGLVGTFQLVEGRVRKAARVGPNVYLNFADDWRSDFTVVIPAKAIPAWTRAGSDPLQMAGKHIRVRGIIELLNGPMIAAPQPEVVEVLD